MKKANLLIIALTVLANTFSNAQSWSVSPGTVDMAMHAVVYIESVYPKTVQPGTNETITGTAFLIADSDRVYLVTAKHLVQASLYGKNQHAIAESIFIASSWKKDSKLFKLPVLTNKAPAKTPYILSADKDDIAIFSFQKNKYKPILAAILKDENKPIPIDSIDMNYHGADESFFIVAYSVFIDKWVKTRSKGLAPGTIKTYNPASPTFSVNWDGGQSNSGAPVILNDKIIGILIHETGVLSNADVIRDPYRRAKTATAIKASCILSLLKKLQQNENKPGFN